MSKDQLQPIVTEDSGLLQKADAFYRRHKAGMHVFGTAVFLTSNILAFSALAPKRVNAGGGENCKPPVGLDEKQKNLFDFLVLTLSQGKGCEVDRSTRISPPDFGSVPVTQSLEEVRIPGCSVTYRFSQREEGGVSMTRVQGKTLDQRARFFQYVASLHGTSVDQIVRDNNLDSTLVPADGKQIKIRETKAKEFKAKNSAEYFGFVSQLLTNIRQCGAWYEAQVPGNKSAEDLRLSADVFLSVSREIESINPPEEDGEKWKVFRKEIKVILTHRFNSSSRLLEAETSPDPNDKNGLRNQAAVFNRLATKSMSGLLEKTAVSEGEFDSEIEKLLNILRFGGAFVPESTQTS